MDRLAVPLRYARAVIDETVNFQETSMPQYDDDLVLGPAIAGGPYNSASTGVAAGGLLAANPAGGSSPMTRGIGPLGRIFIYDQVPLAIVAASLAAAQTLAGAGNLTLKAGTGITAVVDAGGVTRYQFDVPRCVAITSTSDLSAVNFTVKGYDVYGQAMTQTLAGGATATVVTKKAFFQVISIAASAAVAANASAQQSDTLGLPALVADKGYAASIFWNGAAAAAANLTVGDATAASATTGDVRGTYNVGAISASDGVKRFVMSILLPGAAVGPKATRAGALGLTQF